MTLPNTTNSVSESLEILRGQGQVLQIFQIKHYFECLSVILQETDPKNIFNYEECCMTDDPRSKLVICRISRRSVERV